MQNRVQQILKENLEVKLISSASVKEQCLYIDTELGSGHLRGPSGLEEIPEEIGRTSALPIVIQLGVWWFFIVNWHAFGFKYPKVLFPLLLSTPVGMLSHSH
jgi:hypothetical protein